MMTKVTLTLEQLVEAYQALSVLARDARLPVNQAYWLGQQFKTIRAAYEVFTAQKLERIKATGAEEDEHGLLTVPDDKAVEYNAAYREWIKETVDLELDQRPISFLTETKLDGMGLAMQLALVDFLFTGEPPAPEPPKRRRR